jgi:Tfp pilus assembly protein PilF
VEQARDCFLRALEIDPHYTDARVALAATLSKLHRDDEAMAEFRTALLAEPDHPEAHNGIGVLLYRKQLPIEAIRHYRSALARKPKHVDAMVGLANALKSISEHDEALEMARRAVALRPDHAWAASVLGGILGETGSIDEADVQLRRALALAPDQPEFSYAVVQLKKIAPGDDALRALEDLLPRAATLSVQDQSILHFALAMAYDDIGERDRGFAHLLLGNAAKRSLIDYDAAATASAMDRIAQVFTADCCRRVGTSAIPRACRCSSSACHAPVRLWWSRRWQVTTRCSAPAKEWTYRSAPMAFAPNDPARRDFPMRS